jgi:hypothetical protein
MLLLEEKSIENVVLSTSINLRDTMSVKVLDDEVLWNFLVISGYLKIENAILTDDGDTICNVRITNKELLKLFKDIISGWFRTGEVSTGIIKDMLNDLINGNIKEFEESFRYLVRKTFSSFDTGRKAAENFYHAFVLGLLVNLDDRYRVVSNKESGDGRPEVMIIPKDNMLKGTVIEFKVADANDEESMKAAVKKALDQIEKKNYIDEFLYVGIKDVTRIGIAFFGKNVYLGYDIINIH